MLEASSPTGFSHLPFSGLVGSPSTVLMLLAGEHPGELLGCWAFLAGSVPPEDMDLVQTGPSGNRSRGWDCGKEDSSGRSGLGRSCLCLTHLSWPSIPTSLQGKGWYPAASGGLPRLPWSFQWLLDPRGCTLRGLHTHACHIMNPTGGFWYGGCRRGSAKPPELWVFLPMDISWTLPPHTHMTLAGPVVPWNGPGCRWPHILLYRGWRKQNNKRSHRWPPGLSCCFLGVGLLFSAVLRLSWGPSQPCPHAAFLHAWAFSAAPEVS